MRIGRFEIGFKPKQPTPPTGAVGVAASLLYNSGDFNYYNPDELVGRQSYSIYRKMMRDEQVKAVYRFRRNSITGRRSYFKFPEEIEEELSEEERDLRIRVFEAAIGSVQGNFRRALNKVMTSMTYGFSLNEKIYKSIYVDNRPYWGLDHILIRPAGTIKPQRENSGIIKKVTQEQGNRFVPLEMERFIHHVHNPEEDDFYGLSELREAYRMWWSKDVVIKLRNIFLERAAGGLVWVQPTENGPDLQAGSPTYNQMVSVLGTLTTNTGLIVPKGVEMHVEMPKDCRAFDEAIKSFDKGISKAALMPNLLGLSESGQTGSYSQSQTHLEAFLWMLDGEADDLVETLNEQLFKQVGEYNFGDGIYPEYKLRPLSKEMVKQLADVWGNLIQKGAVEATDTDEEFLREYLELPDKGTPLKKPAPQIPSQPVLPEQPGQQQPDNPTNTPEGGVAETVIGRTGTAIDTKYAKAIMTVASRRVDFVAIDASASTAQAVYTDMVGATMNGIVQHFVEQVRQDSTLTSNPDAITSLRVPNSMTSQLRKDSTKMLQDGWKLGTSHAKRELAKVQKNMSAEWHEQFATIGDVAANYFKARSFKMAGKLSQDALDIVQNILFNSIKYSKSIDDTVNEIYRVFALKGMLDLTQLDDVKQALSEAIGYENPTARLQTTVRTGYFEAVNESRFNMFSDAGLNGFVTALAYSATLDSRSTEICKELGGETSPNGQPYVAPVGSAEWDSLRPPNHFNCRSILVPVTQNDNEQVNQWQTSNKPLEGFG